MDGAIQDEAQVDQAGQLLKTQAQAAAAASPGLPDAPEPAGTSDPKWLPKNQYRTDFGLIERTLGSEAFKTMTDVGLTMYFEHRRGDHGGYVAKVWLSWPLKAHLYKLPKSEVLLTGPTDHARAIRATYCGAVLAELQAKRFCKPLAEPPDWAMRDLETVSGWQRSQASGQRSHANGHCS